MLKEILDKYGEFSDSWITEIKYSKKNNQINSIRIIEILITCANKQNDYTYEVIKLKFIDVFEFKFSEINNGDNFATNDVLLKKEGDTILFDFLPIDHFDYLEENPESNFKIKCKSIEYDFIKLMSNS
jgi:hypothetical protein